MEDESITRLCPKIIIIEGSIKGWCWNLKLWGGSRMWEEISTQLHSLTEIKWSFKLSPNNCSVAFDLYTEALTTRLCILRPPNLRSGTRNAGSDLFLVKRVTSIHYRNVLVSVIPVDSNYFPYATIDICLLTRGWHILWDLLGFSGS